MDGNAFQASYIQSELECRGIPVLGSFADPEEAISNLDAEINIRAAIIAQATQGIATPLTDALRQRKVPYLLLLPSNAMKHEAKPTEAPLLVQPFAAYQVADWVAGVFGA